MNQRQKLAKRLASVVPRSSGVDADTERRFRAMEMELDALSARIGAVAELFDGDLDDLRSRLAALEGKRE